MYHTETIFLETSRLILKTPQLSDLNDLMTLRADPIVMQFTSQGRPQTKEEVEKFLTAAMAYQKKYGFGFCSVFTKENNEFIGQAGLFHVGFNEAQPDIEVAYRLHQNQWGKGYATELAAALIQWGFEHLPDEKIIALCDTRNIASQRVLEKAGMWHTGKRTYQGNAVESYVIYKSDAVELVPYNEAWPAMAKKEIAFLQNILPKNLIVEIEHVGSTAIPGMSAKAIIDIQIAVEQLAIIKPIAIELLPAHQYVYWAENPDPERLFFVKGMPPYGEKRTHHVHITELGSKSWQEKIHFRDHLINHPEVAHEYLALKQSLAKKYPYNREKYTQEKNHFIQNIIDRSPNLTLNECVLSDS